MVDRLIVLLAIPAEYQFVAVLLVGVLVLMLALILVNSIMAMIYSICRLN